MDRLHKKCLIASTVSHGLLLVTVLVGAAFVARQSASPEVTLLTTIPHDILDNVLNGGGGSPPAVVARPQVNPTPAPPPPVSPPKVKPRPSPPPEPEAPRTAVKRPVEPETAAPVKPDGFLKAGKKDTATDTAHKGPKINTEVKTRPNEKAIKARQKDAADREAVEMARKEQIDKFNRLYGSLGGSLRSGPVSISDVTGSGGGTPGAAGYIQVVLSLYDAAWDAPAEIEDNSLVATVRVRVARSGRVVSATIIKRSGNAAMDRSVQNALDAVREIRPFPEGATDLERTFRIDFDLKKKRASV